MSKQQERLQMGPREIEEVLEWYDIGDVTDVHPFERGSRRSPKAIVRTLQGTYLLKRRAPGQDDMERIRFQHAVQVHLEQQGCPVAGLIRAQRNGNTVVRRGSRVYELFHFVEGKRFKSSIDQMKAAGTIMARMHDACLDWSGPEPSGAGYHGSPDVEQGFRLIEERIDSIGAYCRPVQDIFGEAQSKVDDLGWADLPRTIVHGDWHPGNLLFQGEGVAALLDFDSTRLEPRISEFANGSLQFAMRFGEPVDVALPESPDVHALVAMHQGYNGGTFEVLEDHECAMAPWLMIEAVIVEGIVPLAMRGRFGHIPAPIFLQHMQKTAKWLKSNAEEIIGRMTK